MDLIIFPECALIGYPPRDIAGSDRINVNVVSEAKQELQKLADELDIHIIVKHFEFRGLLWRFTSIAGLFVLADRRGRHTSNLGHVKA